MTALTMDSKAHSKYSRLRESIIEHLFLGAVLQLLWQRGIYDTEVLRPEFDAHGYDVVIARGRIIRHVQIKATIRNNKKDVSLHPELAEVASGCMVLVNVTECLNIKGYSFFGGAPGEGLPLAALGGLRPAKRAGFDRDGKRRLKPNHLRLPVNKFTQFAELGDLVEALLGPLPIEGTMTPRRRSARQPTPARSRRRPRRHAARSARTSRYGTALRRCRNRGSPPASRGWCR